MNIGKDISFSRLKKSVTDIFIRVLGFWISIGIIFSILIILLFVFIHPLSNKYAKTYVDLENVLLALEKYAVKKDLYNDKWIASKKQETDLYDKELEKCKSFLKGKDVRLETIFPIEDPEKGLITLRDEALWKNEYVKREAVLLTKLKGNNIILPEGALPFQHWGSDIPTWDTILSAQKKFWILETLINIILNNTGITKLEKIMFLESSHIYDSSFAQIYTAIPFTLQIELQADRIQFFLHDIFKSDILFVIENIGILSTDIIFNPISSMGDKDTFIKNIDNYLSNPIVNITIDAYAIDYRK